jgi:plastocyanin
MLKRGSTGRRFWLLVAVAALGAMVYAAIALAADPINATDNAYNAPTYTMNQGERPTFTDGGANQHNVTARTNGPDNRALFSTPTLNGGQQAAVDGTQYLTAGTYTFFCTIHPTEMQATLVVTGNGTPQARPSATLTLRTKTISKAVKKGISVALNTSAKIDDVSLVAKLGKATIGRASDISLAQGQVFETIKLSKSGKSKLRKKSSAKVTVTAEIPFGSPATAKAKLK